MEVSTRNQHRIVRLLRSDLSNLAETALWDKLNTYGDVSVFYMNHPDSSYQYTCYVNNHHNTCGNSIQLTLQQTLNNIKEALWTRIHQLELF